MTASDEYFTPEQIDEQIEQLRQTTPLNGSTDEARLVNALHRYYHAPVTAEDRAALASVRQRITITGKQDTVDTFEDGNEAVVPFSPSQRIAHPRSTRLTRILSSLAAVILVGTLIGAWFAVTRMAGTPSTVLPSSVPKSLYTVQNGVAYRLDGSSGKVIWQDHLATGKKSGSANLQVVNNVMYVVLDFDIYALNASNGAQIWHVVNHTKKAYFWFVIANGRLYLYSLDYTFSALNTANGELLWHNTTFTTENGYGFTVSDGNLYTVSNNGSTLYTLDGATGQVRWHIYLSDVSLLQPPLVANGVVYVASGNLLYALKEQNGERIWQQTVPVLGDFATSYLVNGILYVTNDTPIADVGSVGSQQNVDNRNFFAYNARSGQLLWETETGYDTLFNLPIAGGLLFAARNDNGAYSIGGLNPQTGKVAWQAPFQCAVGRFNQQVSPTCSAVWTAIMNGKLYLLESDSQSQGKAVYTLKSFDPATGQLLSAHQLTFGQQDTVGVVGASNGLLYLQIGKSKWANGIPYSNFIFAAYRLSDGSLAWSHTMPSFPPPTSANTQPNTSQPVLAP